MLWTVWDVAVGLAIVVTSIPLLFCRQCDCQTRQPSLGLGHSGWTIYSWLALQIVGHQLFEGKRPTSLDNPVQMLISPIYVFAKLFIALGLRSDLAAVLQKSSQQTPLYRPRWPIGGGADVGKNFVKQTLVTGGGGFIEQHFVAVFSRNCRAD